MEKGVDLYIEEPESVERDATEIRFQGQNKIAVKKGIEGQIPGDNQPIEKNTT